MRQDDLIGRMLASDHAVILFDRRDDVSNQAEAIGYEVLDCVEMKSPIAETNVRIALLRPQKDPTTEPTLQMAPDPRQRSPSFVRMLDRFYVPAAGDPIVSSLFFEMIAERYEELTSKEVNQSTAEILLQSALRHSPGEGIRRVLDFGCGTGCSINALKALGAVARDVELIGTDVSDAMLSIAGGRGLKVMTLPEWRALPPSSFTAAISCFVLHYGVPEEDLANVTRCLQVGGVFSANLFKAGESSVERAVATFASLGLELISNEQLNTTPGTFNRHLLFRKYGRANS